MKRYSVYSVVSLFIIFIILFRFILIFSDEPDYWIRTYWILYVPEKRPVWSPYALLKPFFENFNFKELPNFNIKALGLFGSIENYNLESISQKVIRLITTAITTLPLILVLFCKKEAFNLSKKISREDMIRRYESLCISLTFPGFLYYVGVFADEQLTLVLGVLFIFFEGTFFSILLLIPMLFLDTGNTAVVIVFYFNLLFYRKIAKNNRLRTVFIIGIIQIFVFYVLGSIILKLITSIGILSKLGFGGILQSMEIYDLADKYPLILRPIVTYLTYIFYTPHYCKSIISYIGYFVLILILVLNLKKNYNKRIINQANKKIITDAYSSLVFIISIVYFFPGYGNAKYYMFILPVFISLFKLVFSNRTLVFFNILNILIIFINLLLLRV